MSSSKLPQTGEALAGSAILGPKFIILTIIAVAVAIILVKLTDAKS